jgi:hypothetical protein
MLREKSVLRHLVKFSGFQVKHNSASTNNRDCATTISMVLGQLRAGKVWRPRIAVWLPAGESITANPDERPGVCRGAAALLFAGTQQVLPLRRDASSPIVLHVFQTCLY